jgi:hypothetical protein
MENLNLETKTTSLEIRNEIMKNMLHFFGDGEYREELYENEIRKSFRGCDHVKYSMNADLIIGAFENYLYIRGRFLGESESGEDIDQDCIIKISHKLYMKSMKYCLKYTKKASELYEIYCEAQTYIDSYDYEEIVEEDLKQLGLKVYRVYDFVYDKDWVYFGQGTFINSFLKSKKSTEEIFPE